MKGLTILARFSTIVFALSACSGMRLLHAQVPPSSARAFVSRFYKWYVPQALSDYAESAWSIALRDRAGIFDPQLVRLLRVDLSAQARCEDIVGLDFDPFLNSQDPPEHYEVGKIKQQGNGYMAEVYSVQSGQRSSRPAVSASIRRANGRWMFVNFYYPSGADLVTMLQAPKLPCSSPRLARNN